MPAMVLEAPGTPLLHAESPVPEPGQAGARDRACLRAGRLRGAAVLVPGED
jgi:hypothetical protein